jgi:dTDP-4-dehydrorhamnose 3,5-epimerase
MKLFHLAIPDVLLIEPQVFSDDRGFFFESFNRKNFEKAISRELVFVQDNHSKSVRNVLRGLHYQLEQPQGKLVRVAVGEVFDVAVDIRKSSPTCGKWVGEFISAQNRKQLWIPEGFAHGFLVLSETAECLYKTTDYWAGESERTIIWNDPVLNIKWPSVQNPHMSAKDRSGTGFLDAELFA